MQKQERKNSPSFFFAVHSERIFPPFYIWTFGLVLRDVIKRRDTCYAEYTRPGTEGAEAATMDAAQASETVSCGVLSLSCFLWPRSGCLHKRSQVTAGIPSRIYIQADLLLICLWYVVFYIPAVRSYLLVFYEVLRAHYVASQVKGGRWLATLHYLAALYSLLIRSAPFALFPFVMMIKKNTQTTNTKFPLLSDAAGGSFYPRRTCFPHPRPRDGFTSPHACHVGR